MTRLDRIMPFVMENWTLVLIACVLVSAVCLFRRRAPWVIAVWLPSFALAWTFTVFFWSVFFAPRGPHTPDDGFLGMAIMFQALFSLPVFLTALLLLFARPSGAAWRSPFVFVGVLLIAVVPLLLRATFYATQLGVSFLVTGTGGDPMPGVSFRLTGAPVPVAFTDSRGQLTWRMEHGRGFSSVFSSDGYQDHSVHVERSGARGESLFVSHTWYEHRGSPFERRGSSYKKTESAQASYPKSPPPVIPIVMKPLRPR